MSALTAKLDRHNDVVMPLVAVALAVSGFFLFGGSQSTTRVNGEIVSESRTNILGVLLAIAAVVIAAKHLRMRGGAVEIRRGLSVLAIGLAVVQALYSLDVI